MLFFLSTNKTAQHEQYKNNQKPIWFSSPPLIARFPPASGMQRRYCSMAYQRSSLLFATAGVSIQSFTVELLSSAIYATTGCANSRRQKEKQSSLHQAFRFNRCRCLVFNQQRSILYFPTAPAGKNKVSNFGNMYCICKKVHLKLSHC